MDENRIYVRFACFVYCAVIVDCVIKFFCNRTPDALRLAAVYQLIDPVKHSRAAGIKGIMAASMQGIQNTVSNVMSAINTITGGKLDEVRNAFQSKIEAAKSVVSNGLNAIKGFFSGLSLKLPDIKLPHFSISGSFSLSPPSIPKIGVEWYKEGGILTGPTIFGANNGSLLGGGEAGRYALHRSGHNALDSAASGCIRRFHAFQV